MCTFATTALLTAVLAASDFYQTLGVPPLADQATIKQAYRGLALKHHPDKAGDAEASAERFKRIQEAYEVLGDEARRKRYDLQRNSGFHDFHSARPNDFHFSSHAQNPFEGFFSQPPQQMIVQPARRVFRCSLAELDAGGSRIFILRDTPLARIRDAFNDGMHGVGAQVVAQLGTAALTIIWRFPGVIFGRPWWLRLPLFTLAYLIAILQKLPPSPDGTFDFQVKPGWREGTRVTFAPTGQGPRKVIFELREKRHPRLERQRHNLLFRCRLSRRRAARGASLRVPQLNQPPLVVELKPGQAVDGQTLVLEGRGMPIKGGPARGDLHISFTVKA